MQWRIKTDEFKFDQIIIIDIESTCWQYISPGQLSEIIEIGICPIYTKTRELLPEDSIIVKPKLPISDYCTKLTSITQDDVDIGITFSEACLLLENKYKTRKYVWASYGNYDRSQFEIQCQRENVRYPFSDIHINVKALFALVYSLDRAVGMAEALKILEMPLEGRHHRGKDDAKNIAKIFQKLLFLKK